jgi:hypothetical protein
MIHQWRPPQDGMSRAGTLGLLSAACHPSSPSTVEINETGPARRERYSPLVSPREPALPESHPVAIALITLHAPGKLVKPAVVTRNLRQDGLGYEGCLKNAFGEDLGGLV